VVASITLITCFQFHRGVTKHCTIHTGLKEKTELKMKTGIREGNAKDRPNYNVT